MTDVRTPSALDPRSDSAAQIADLWWLMLGLGGAVAVLVIGLLVLIAVRRRDPGDDGTTASGIRWVVLGGVVLPVVVLVPLSLQVLRVNAAVTSPPDGDALRIDVTGNQFWWDVRYPDHDAVTANEIHVPVGREVEVRLTTDDVIHSFWVPNLHGKIDMIPGEETALVFEADAAGTYQGLCAEFCGIQHANMLFLVVAQEPDEFEEWLELQAADAQPPVGPGAEAGQEAFFVTGCASCHTIRGTAAVGELGPDLTHVASRRTLGAGVVDNTRGNLGGWIANAQHIKPGNRMPPIPLEPDQLRGLLDYLEGLE